MVFCDQIVRQCPRLAEFKIVFFDEIDDPLKVTMLFQLSLSFTATPKVLEELRANDNRYTPEFGVFALTERGNVAAGHLLMKIPTETTVGRLDVGGVNAVGTNPSFARRGAMTAVMNASHKYFREHGLEHSVLTTSRTLGAMMLYERLGYVELARSTLAMKFPNQPRMSAKSEINIRPTRTKTFRKLTESSRKRWPEVMDLLIGRTTS